MKSQPTNTMIVTQPKTNIVTSGVVNSVSFGIKQEGLAHIFNVLRNQLYSNKIMAVLREYSCNAVDAHTEAGIPDRPIQVTLPNRMSLELKIRDFGYGLSEEDIHNIYAFYGESTKRQSNALIGQLGLGSKSAFAYGDNFVINSFCDGKKTSYNAYIDATQVGQIAKLYSTASDEESGVEIVIPVNADDISQFESTAAQVFKYFKVRPVILGATPSFDDKKTIFQGSDWRIVESNGRWSGGSIAVMGNIGYTLSSDSLKLKSDSEDDEACRSLLNNFAVEIQANIGDLDIAASREGLQYTDRTIKNIKAKLLAVRDEIRSKFEAELQSAKSLWSVRKMIGSALDMSHPYNFAARCIKSFSWGNHKNISNLIRFPKSLNQGDFVLYVPKKGYVGGNYLIKGGDQTDTLGDRQVSLSDRFVAIENTKGLKTGIINYAFNYLKDGKSVVVMNFKSKQERASLMQACGMVESDVVDMATLTKIILPRNTRSTKTLSGTNLAVRAKHTKRAFALDPSQRKRYTSVQSDYWIETDVDMTDASLAENTAWIEIDRFLPTINNVNNSNNSFIDATSSLELIGNAVGMKIPVPKVIGLKKPIDTKDSKVNHITKFAENILNKVEKKANLSEKFARFEAMRQFKQENPLLWDTLVKQYKDKNTKIPNTLKVFTRINDILGYEYDKMAALYQNFHAVCGQFAIKKESILTTKLSDELAQTKLIAAQLEKTMRLLKYVDSYAVASYRDNHKLAREAVVDLIESRDATLEGVA